MMTTNRLHWLLAALTLTTFTTASLSDTAMKDALQAGARKLTADEIAERLIGHTVTFVSAGSGNRSHVFYGPDNQAMNRKEGSDAVSSGFHAVTDRDQLCLGWQGRDLPRLRCLDVLEIDGVLHKFGSNGNLRGRIIEFARGNTT